MALLLKDSKQNIYKIDIMNKEFTTIEILKYSIEDKYGFCRNKIKVFSDEIELTNNDDVVYLEKYPNGLHIDNLQYPKVNIHYDKEVDMEEINKLFELTNEEKEIKSNPVKENDVSVSSYLQILMNMGIEKSIASKALRKSMNNISIALDLINEGFIKKDETIQKENE